MRVRWAHAVQRCLLGLFAISLIACQRPAPEESETPAVSAVETAISTPTPPPTETPEPPDTPREEATAPAPEPTATEEDSEIPPTETNEEASTEAPAEDSVEEEASEENEGAETSDLPDTHTVSAGETLYQIGLQYGLSWVSLAEINDISTPNELFVGQQIRLNGDPSAPEPTPSPNTETTYIVQPGENLFRIGLEYGMTWTQIAEANGLINPNQIEVGQVLKIPVSVPGPLPEFVHTVQQNDTLLTIALLYGVPWRTIAQANSIDSPYLIFPGQQITIPSP